MKTRISVALLAAASFLLGTSQAGAQTWPDRPIKWVVPFTAGGANDVVARAAAEAVSRRLGQPIIIENKPGAGTVIGTDYVTKSKPDGYTFLIGSAGVVTNSFLNDKISYADSDIVPVAMIASSPSVIVVHPSLPVNNLKEFVEYAKKQGKDGANFATAGSGSTPHFVIEMLKEGSGANFTAIPFKSGQESVTAVLGNQVTATSESSVVVLPHIKAGTLKALAATSEARMTAYPNIPTTAEQGFKDVRIGHWAGLFAPKGTSAAIIERMNAEIQGALKSKELRDKLIPSGIEPVPGSVADFTAFITSERERLSRIAKKAGMKSDH
ncbi:MAG TPA: tripartite tricarboxylate transporter substrate binding protein [Usitatibacteraceae bacterium]